MSRLFSGKIVSALIVLLLWAGFAKGQAEGQPNGALIAELSLSKQRVQTVAFSPDGKLLAAGYGFYDNGGITVWKVADRSVVVTLLGGGESSKAGIARVAFSADGKLFAAANDDGGVMLWTVGSWRTHKILLEGRGDANDLIFSPDSTKLAYASDKAAILYDLRNGKVSVIATGNKYRNSFNGVSFTPDGKYVVVCRDESIQVWNIETGETEKIWNVKTFGFFGRLSPDGKHLVTGGGGIYGNKVVEIRNFPEGKVVNELTEFRNGLFALAISHSGKLFAVAGGSYGGEGNVSLRSLDDARELGFVSFGDFPIKGIAFSPDDSLLAAASESGFILLYAVDRIRGVESKKQDYALCGEIVVEGKKTFVAPLSKVPSPMRPALQYAWRMEVVNAERLTGVAGLPVALQDWAIESGAAGDRARVGEFRTLAAHARTPEINSQQIVFGDVQNPGWNEGFTAKIYGDGRFVAADNSGKCLAYGHLDQLKTDFQTLRKRLVESGLLSLPTQPLAPQTAHFRVRFIELMSDGVREVRTDADSFEALLKGEPAKKREAFSRIFDGEESFLNSLLHAGLKP